MTTNTSKRLKRQWKCTHEPAFIQEEGLPSRVGDTSVNYDPSLEPEMTMRWRTKDDDGVIGYQGIATPTTEFEPLDDLAMPDIGDVTIEYFERGKWRTL